MFPPRAGYFSTPLLLASLPEKTRAFGAQTVFPADAPLRGQGCPEKSPMRALGK